MEAVRQCQAAIQGFGQAREDHPYSRLFSTGNGISHQSASWINIPQQRRELNEASVEVAAPGEGVLATCRVNNSQICEAAGTCEFPLVR